MIKNDKWIISQGEKLVSPFDLDMVNPSSLDIRIGEKMLLMKCSNTSYQGTIKGLLSNREMFAEKDILDEMVAELNNSVEWKEIDLIRTSQTCPFWLFPNEKILVESLETFYFPDNVCGQFKLKSSRGREFYNHIFAGYCDPGWNGSKLTMEIENRSLKILPIFKGLRIGQIIFQETETPAKSYRVTGRYNNDSSVQQSRG
jgi:deoxycytidine triphosphate deaminase